MIKEQEPQAIRQLAGGVQKLEEDRGGSTRKEQWTVEHLEGTGPGREHKPQCEHLQGKEGTQRGTFNESRQSNV